MGYGRKLEERGETSSASVSTKLAPGSAPGRSRETRTSGTRAGAFQSLPGHPRASPASSAWARRESYWERKRKWVPSQDVTAPQSREEEGRALLGATLLPLPWWRNEALRGNACSPYCLWGGSQIHPLYFQSPPDAVAFPRLALGLPRHH